MVSDGENRLVTAAEAARLLSVSLSTLERWRFQGQGPEPVRLGRMIRYRSADIRRLTG